MDSDIIQGTTMNLRKFRKATVKKRQLLDKEVCKKKRRMLIDLNSGRFDEKMVDEENSNLSAITSSRDMEKSELLSETSNTMTLEQFTDIVLASEGMTLNNNNECTNSSLGLGYEAATPNPKIGGITQVNDKKVNFTQQHPFQKTPF